MMTGIFLTLRVPEIYVQTLFNLLRDIGYQIDLPVPGDVLRHCRFAEDGLPFKSSAEALLSYLDKANVQLALVHSALTPLPAEEGTQMSGGLRSRALSQVGTAEKPSLSIASASDMDVLDVVFRRCKSVRIECDTLAVVMPDLQLELMAR